VRRKERACRSSGTRHVQRSWHSQAVYELGLSDGMTTKLTNKEHNMYNFSYIIAVCRCISYSKYTHYTVNVWMNILQSAEKKVGRPRKRWRDQNPWRRNNDLPLLLMIIVIIHCFIFGKKLLLNTYRIIFLLNRCTRQSPAESDETRGCIYRVSQEECARLREGVPYVKVYWYNPKHLCPKLNGYGDNGQRSLKLWQLLHTCWLPNTY